MPTDLENYYLRFPEPIQGCLLALKDLILSTDKNIIQQRKYQIPFFYYKDKKLAYLWVNQKKLYLGIVAHDVNPAERKRINTIYSFLIDPKADLPVGDINCKLREQMSKY